MPRHDEDDDYDEASLDEDPLPEDQDDDDSLDDEDDTEPCPFCGRPLHHDAAVCPGCGNFVDLRSASARKRPWIYLAALLALLAMFAAVVWWVV